MMRIKEIIAALERFAPLPLQDDYDNSGLQVGLTEAEATGALLCLDVTEAVLAEAKTLGCNLVISHHPLLFHPLKSISDADYVGRCVMYAIKNGITIYASHTNLDNAKGGVNMKIAEILGLSDLRPLVEIGDGNGSGLIGSLKQPISNSRLIENVKMLFDVSCVRHNSLLENNIKTVAVCGGAGGFLIPNALEKGADVFVSGEIGYHRFFGLEGRMNLVEIGHFESEQFTVNLLKDVLSKSVPELKICLTTVRTNPIEYLN